tara:strand:- start:478 stop:897 length:420 start_codon:yes stop_codon:yes gene_type:complete
MFEFKPRKIKSHTSNRKYDGTYHRSNFFSIGGYREIKWMIVMEIECDIPAMKKQGYENADIVRECVTFLNKAPEKKKYARKEPQPKYGNLELYDFSFRREVSGEIIQLLLLTDQKKNKFLRGKGKNKVKSRRRWATKKK